MLAKEGSDGLYCWRLHVLVVEFSSGPSGGRQRLPLRVKNRQEQPFFAQAKAAQPNPTFTVAHNNIQSQAHRRSTDTRPRYCIQASTDELQQNNAMTAGLRLRPDATMSELWPEPDDDDVCFSAILLGLV